MQDRVHKKVIYTALTGGHDNLKQPTCIAPGWDYICFTDSELPADGTQHTSGVWQLRTIPFKGGQIEKARRMKILPHIYLPEYEYSVWMDANLCICGEEFYEKVDALITAEEKLAMIAHPSRNCVYDELCVCYKTKRITWRQANHHLTYLLDSRMPRHRGLYETNIVFRKHLADELIALDETWWALFAQCSTRDQLSFTPVLRYSPLMPVLFLGQGNSARNVNYIAYSTHTAGGGPKMRKWVKWFRLAMEKCLRMRIYMAEKHKHL